MATPDEIESLQIFIDSAKELEVSKFFAQATEGVISASIRGGKPERRGPEHEAVKALLLTVRFFCQDNETSIKQVADLVNGLDISTPLKDRFAAVRDGLNRFLDASSPPLMFHDTPAGAETSRKVFETFLYGSFAHANRERRRRVKTWEKHHYYNELRAWFDVVLLRFIDAIIKMKTTCVLILTELGVGAEPGAAADDGA